MNSYDDNRGFDNRPNRNDRRDNNRDSGNGRDDGKVQLFFAKGRNDQITTESLIEFISTSAGIDETTISGIKILDAFSFFVVPEEDAAIILDFFQEAAGEGRPVVSKAKRKTENRDSGRRRDDRRDDRRGNGFGGGNGGGGYRNNDRGNDRRDDRGGRRDSFGNSGNYGGNDRKPRNY